MYKLKWTNILSIGRIRSLKLDLLCTNKPMFSDVFRWSIPSICFSFKLGIHQILRSAKEEVRKLESCVEFHVAFVVVRWQEDKNGKDCCQLWITMDDHTLGELTNQNKNRRLLTDTFLDIWITTFQKDVPISTYRH